MNQSGKRIRLQPLTWLLIVVGLALVALVVVYLKDTAAALPGWLPGHQAGSPHHHTKHAIVCAGLAIVAWIGAWFTTGPAAGAEHR